MKPAIKTWIGSYSTYLKLCMPCLGTAHYKANHTVQFWNRIHKIFVTCRFQIKMGRWEHLTAIPHEHVTVFVRIPTATSVMEIIEAIYQPRRKGIIDTQPGQIREFSSCSTILSKWPIQWYVMFHKSLAKHVVCQLSIKRHNTVYSFEPTSISEFSNVYQMYSQRFEEFSF